MIIQNSWCLSHTIFVAQLLYLVSLTLPSTCFYGSCSFSTRLLCILFLSGVSDDLSVMFLPCFAYLSYSEFFFLALLYDLIKATMMVEIC